jgi:hypothetical protein
MTPDEAYAALNHLRSVLRVPSRGGAHKENLKPFHKSFIDYISDSKRSGFSPDIQREAQQINLTECAFSVLNEAPDGVDFGDLRYIIIYGTFFFFFFFLKSMGCISTSTLRVILIVPPTLRTPVDYQPSTANLDYKLANNMTAQAKKKRKVK